MNGSGGIGERWIYLKVKNKSSLVQLRGILEACDFPYCFLADLPDDNRGCCRRLKKDFLSNRLLINVSEEAAVNFVKSHKEHLRFVGQYGKAAPAVSMAEYRRLTLFFDKLDRDIVFETGCPPTAKKVRLPGGTMAGVEGHLEYRGIGGYRLYFSILDLCTISIRVDKKELAVRENRWVARDPSVPHWYVLCCRRERELYRLLLKRGYKAYIPLRKKSAESGMPDKELVMRGYVFLQIAPGKFPELFGDIPGIADRLMFDRSQSLRTPLIIPDKQFEDFVFITENSSDDVIFMEESCRIGDRVGLCKKGFEGIEGTLVKNGNQSLVFVSLPHLQSGYLIKIEKGEFRKV